MVRPSIGTAPPLAGLRWGVVARHMRRHIQSAQRSYMIRGVVGLILAHRDATSGDFVSDLQHGLRGRLSAVPSACVTAPATARPCRFSIVTCPM